MNPEYDPAISESDPTVSELIVVTKLAKPTHLNWLQTALCRHQTAVLHHYHLYLIPTQIRPQSITVHCVLYGITSTPTRYHPIYHLPGQIRD